MTVDSLIYLASLVKSDSRNRDANTVESNTEVERLENVRMEEIQLKEDATGGNNQ